MRIEKLARKELVMINYIARVFPPAACNKKITANKTLALKFTIEMPVY